MDPDSIARQAAAALHERAAEVADTDAALARVVAAKPSVRRRPLSVRLRWLGPVAAVAAAALLVTAAVIGIGHQDTDDSRSITPAVPVTDTLDAAPDSTAASSISTVPSSTSPADNTTTPSFIHAGTAVPACNVAAPLVAPLAPSQVLGCADGTQVWLTGVLGTSPTGAQAVCDTENLSAGGSCSGPGIAIAEGAIAASGATSFHGVVTGGALQLTELGATVEHACSPVPAFQPTVLPGGFDDRQLPGSGAAITIDPGTGAAVPTTLQPDGTRVTHYAGIAGAHIDVVLGQRVTPFATVTVLSVLGVPASLGSVEDGTIMTFDMGDGCGPYQLIASGVSDGDFRAFATGLQRTVQPSPTIAGAEDPACSLVANALTSMDTIGLLPSVAKPLGTESTGTVGCEIYLAPGTLTDSAIALGTVSDDSAVHRGRTGDADEVQITLRSGLQAYLDPTGRDSDELDGDSLVSIVHADGSTVFVRAFLPIVSVDVLADLADQLGRAFAG